MPIEDRFPFVSDAAKSLFSAETIHAMNNVFVVRIRGHKVSMKSAESDTRKEDPTRKRKVGSYEFEASVPISAVLISSDQLVDLCNIIAGTIRLSSISRSFFAMPDYANRLFSQRIDAALELILDGWKNPKEFYDIASYMKNKYTSVFLGAYESASHLESMKIIMNEAKLKTIQALSRIALKRSEAVSTNATIKAPEFASKFEKILEGLSAYRQMELCSMLPLLPTTERYLSDLFFRIHSMGETERPQSEFQIRNFLRIYESTVAEWAIRINGSTMNVDVDAGFEKTLSDSLKAQREVTEIDGKKYKAPYELPTALIGKVRYRRPTGRTMWGRYWHLLSKPVSDFPNEEDEGFSSEMLAAIRFGRNIYLDMDYEEILRYAAQYGIGFQLFSAGLQSRLPENFSCLQMMKRRRDFSRYCQNMSIRLEYPKDQPVHCGSTYRELACGFPPMDFCK